jgi:hemolysin III
MPAPLPSLQVRQELANILTHGVGILFGIVAIPILIALATNSGQVAGLVGVAIYGFSFLMVFTSSTIYHSTFEPRIKQVMRKVDHISIYFLIAGSYTPFILLYLYNGLGFTILAIEWGFAIFGIFYKLFFINRSNILSVIIYLGMGWAAVFAPSSFFTSMPTESLVLIVTGGLLYTLGVIFYLWERLPYHHAIWHIFVLAAAICHYVAVLYAMA